MRQSLCALDSFLSSSMRVRDMTKGLCAARKVNEKGVCFYSIVIYILFLQHLMCMKVVSTS